MFRDLQTDYDAFFAYGIGAMCWAHMEEPLSLWFLAPCSMSEKGWEPARILTMTDGKDWTVPGDVSGWDGNIERPTFDPSIWLSDRKGWHGYIQDGNLVDA